MGFQCISEKMRSLTRAMDEKSGQIIMYFLRERHAGIRELANLISASSDMEVLIRIRKVINPKAQEILGNPILSFELCKTDPLTGKKINYSWWLKEEVIDGLGSAELLDVFYEKDALRVVTFLPSQETNVEVKVKDDFLIISGKEYHREIPLFYPVETEVRKNLNNGVLEVILNKVDEMGKRADRD